MQCDAKAILEDIGVRKTPVFSGIRPTVKIKDDYMTTSVITFDDSSNQTGIYDAEVSFISPKYYANSLWKGKKLEVYEGARVIAYLTITEIINPILNRDEEKWILLDGREMDTPADFYSQIQLCMTKNIDFQAGCNLNALNDLLWGGFGVHEYGEPLHIVWIYAEKSKKLLGEKRFEEIQRLIKNHESGNKYLELYPEHAF